MGQCQIPVDQGSHAVLGPRARKLSWKETAEAFHTSWDRVRDSVEYVVTWGLDHRILESLRAIGVDGARNLREGVVRILALLDGGHLELPFGWGWGLARGGREERGRVSLTDRRQVSSRASVAVKGHRLQRWPFLFLQEKSTNVS